jgi:hypothetical protein
MKNERKKMLLDIHGADKDKMTFCLLLQLGAISLYVGSYFDPLTSLEYVLREMVEA